MLRFLDQAYKNADKALGGWLPGGGTGNPLSNTVRDAALSVRNAALEQADRPYHEELFIKAHTGGAKGDGVLREIPDRILRIVKQEVEDDTKRRQDFLADGGKGMNELTAAAQYALENSTDQIHKDAAQNFLDNLDKGKAQAEDLGRKTQGHLSLYGADKEATYSLGTIGVYFDQAGNVTIKDKWKVDGSKQGRSDKPDGRKYRYADLAEGGDIASDVHDWAKMLGLYKEIPIEVKLTKEEWEAIGKDPI